MRREFTGRHITLILVAFFGVVIAVNLYMARMATRDFGGTVVDNSYVASQRFNGWLADARAAEVRGWSASATRQADGRLLLRIRNANGTDEGGQVRATVEHPLGRQPSQPTLTMTGDGPWQSRETLPGGRLRVRVEQRIDGERFRYLVDVL